jgi:hypothetical protein
MWFWLAPLLALVGLLVVAVLLTLGTWIHMSYHTFPDRVLPGASYQVGPHTMQVPLLPHKRYKSKEEARLDRPVPKLPDETLLAIHELGKGIHDTLGEVEVPHWMTGGSLIGLLLWNSTMVYDDDIDMAVNWDYRAYLWSPAFATKLAERDLEAFYLRGSSLKWATREGAAVRVRKRGTVVPTCDIFFVKEVGDGTWAKVNSWSEWNRVVYEPKETWQPGWLFPLRHVHAQGVDWPVGHDAESMLTAQYGPAWSQQILSPSPLTASHRWAFTFTNWVSAWRVGKPEPDSTVPTEKRAHFENPLGNEIPAL